MLLHPVRIKRTISLESYRPFDRPGLMLSDLVTRGRTVGQALGPSKVWMLSSTESGGGVAELLPRLCALLNDVGVDARWLVMKPEDPAFFLATKALHNMLHGEPVSLPLPEIARIYESTSRAVADELRTLVNRSDLLVVHDPQPLGVGSLLPADHQPRLAWRCHVGVAARNEVTEAAWAFLKPFLQPYRRLLFSNELYIPDGLFDRSGVLLPGLDPLNHKNRALTPYKLIGILRSAGLAEGPLQPPWAQFCARVRRYSRGQWVEEPIQELLYQPCIVQVSRFDRLKGFDRLIAGFIHLLRSYPQQVAEMRVHTDRARDELGRVQLILAGPEPNGVSDDPEAQATLADLSERLRQLEPSVAQRIHLLQLPMRDARENALMVNALQRVAAVVAQCSLKEGFGLTVTEAMWKGVPLVASGVGGIALQVRPDTDGILIADPRSEVDVADALLQAIVFPVKSDLRAQSAQSRVRSNFLVTTELSNWLDELARLVDAHGSA